MKIFEAVMLICFGASWPAALYKSITAKSARGKSAPFLWLVLLGYISGLIYKISTGFDLVSYLYLLNALMVSADIVFYYRNRKYDLMASGQGFADNPPG